MADTPPTDASTPRGHLIAVIGSGASGTLLASQLLRRAEPGTHVLLIERSGVFGPGIAYGTTSDAHRLNVGAAQMSPLPKDPAAFFRWSSKRQDGISPVDYLPRRLFGEYLVELLEECERRASGIVTLERCADEVIGVRPSPADAEKQRLALASGRQLDADKVVLALGNSTLNAPVDIPAEIVDSPYFIGDPWTAAALSPARSDEAVMLLGTGLTAVDVALELGVTGGPVIHATSHSGLLPRVHLPQPAAAANPLLQPSDVPRVDDMVASLTAAAIAAVGRGEDWRSVIDSLRPISNQVWDRLDPEEQERFQREYARIWSVHRHRMAPKVGAALTRLTEKGRLRIRAASLTRAQIREGALDVDLSANPSGAAIRLRVGRIINCTGPVHDPLRITAPLVRDLVDRGQVRSNRLRSGFDTAPDGAVLDRDGRTSNSIYAIGPLRSGSLFETTAVPEIAVQARALSTHLTGNPNLRPTRQTRPKLRA